MAIIFGPHRDSRIDGYSSICYDIYNEIKFLNDEDKSLSADRLKFINDYVLPFHDIKGFDPTVIKDSMTLPDGLNVGVFEDELINNSPDIYRGDIVVNFHVPQPEITNVKDGIYLVSLFLWETTGLLPAHVNALNNCDEIWTCSEWSKQVFIENGIYKPIYVFDLGFDPEVFKIKTDFDRGDQPFTYLHIGGNSERKNADMVYYAFMKLHGGDPNYRLILKVSGTDDFLWKKHGLGEKNIGEHPQVYVINNFVSEEGMSELIRMSDCFVYPTTGEGWGLSPFKAIASGVPTICTNGTACEIYANLSVPLEAELAPTPYRDSVYRYGDIVNPKMSDLCDRMSFVENNYDLVVKKTREGAEHLHENYNWDKVGKQYAVRLRAINEIIKRRNV